jgi:hypothetical protein
MAAITSTIAAGVALAGMGMNIAQAIKSNQQAKQASQTAKTAAEQFANIREQNAFKQVQVPTLGYDLAQQAIDRNAQAAMQNLQGAGAEGVIGGTGQIVQAANEQDLQLADQANQAAYQRDIAQAGAQQGINARQAGRDEWLSKSRLVGAQDALAQAQINKQQAIGNAFGAVGNALPYMTNAEQLYKANKQKQGVVGTPQNTTGIFQNNQLSPEAQWDQQYWGSPLYSLGI